MVMFDYDQSGFCSNCKITTTEKGDTKKIANCFETLELMVQMYGGKEKDIKEKLIKEYPQCKKIKIKSKQEEIEEDEKEEGMPISMFCPDCLFEISDGDDAMNPAKTCIELFNFTVSKYSEHEDHVKAIFAQTHRECFHKHEMEYFCPECSYILRVKNSKTGRGYKQTCQARLDFIMRKYGEREEDAKEGLMLEHEQCRKK